MGSFINDGIQLSLAFQSLPDWLTPIMKVFTFMGTTEFYILFLVLVWTFNYSFSLRLGVMLMLTVSLNEILKMAFHLPRPYWVSSSVQDLGGPETGFGLPSGHSQTPVSVYGLFSSGLPKKWQKALVWVIILCIGLSRLILGVHFYFDILVGWTVGFLVLFFFIRYESAVLAFWQSMKARQQVMVIFLLSLLIVFFAYGVQALNQGFELPSLWLENAALAHPEVQLNPFSLDTTITSAGTLFGLVAGIVWLKPFGQFHEATHASKQFLVFIIGLVGVLAIKEGLGAIFPDGATLTTYGLRYLRYALIGFWLTGIAPWLLSKLGLSKLS